MPPTLPYLIAALCYLFDAQGRLLLLHRQKPPNQDLYSPIGGKLNQQIGESPGDCALREIYEEAGVRLKHEDLHLTGVVSESGYADEMHWLMFLYEVTRPVRVERTDFAEGKLEWHPVEEIPRLAIPATDREVIWPLFCKYRHRFFAVHIDCANGKLSWQLQQPHPNSTNPVST